jgi:hypothetical protein
MPFVSITRLRLRSWKYLPGLLFDSWRAALQARRAEGNLAISTLSDAHRAFWTRSVWTDEAAMRAFMTVGVHRGAMPKFLEWCDEATVTHWMQEGAEEPDWMEAHRRLLAEGRPSRINNPSPTHLRCEPPPPRIGPGRSFKFK